MGSSAFCQLCGRKIAGKSQLFHHPDWPEVTRLRTCPDCARDKPRCKICGLPFAPDSNSDLCETCQRKNPVCRACGQAVPGGFSYFDGVGPYCQTCCRNRPPCDICRAPLTDKRWQLSDGRLICSFCQASAVFSLEAAASLFEKLKSQILHDFGIQLNIPTGLVLVDRTQLREVLSQQPIIEEEGVLNGNKHESASVLGIYVRRGMKRGIYIQTGLPRKLFIQIAAHEYAHAWQGENCPTLSNSLIHEGFAEWVAYRAMSSFGYTDDLENMRNRQDIYGEGLRWALNHEHQWGSKAVIDACRDGNRSSQIGALEGRRE